MSRPQDDREHSYGDDTIVRGHWCDVGVLTVLVVLLNILGWWLEMMPNA